MATLPGGPGGNDFWDAGQMPADKPTFVAQPGIEAGGLPPRAQQRLFEQLHRKRPFFTSDLSVNELLLVHDTGVAPVSQVMGSSVYHIGWQFMPYYRSAELDAITHAYWHARVLAISRMQQEAAMLGAHGVVGVRVDTNQYDWGQNLIEFQAIGTAVRIPGMPPPKLPFLSSVSGQDFWALCQAGWFPVGYCFGNCTWYEMATWSTMMANAQLSGGFFGGNTSWYNQELTDFTQGVYTARQLSERRMAEMAVQLGGDGVLGADVVVYYTPYEVDLGNHQMRTDLIVNFHAAGTAVMQIDPASAPQVDYAQFLSD